MGKYPCIMIVDDDQGVLTLVKRIFELEGYDVIIAESGEVALELFEECMPDLVILDIMMPGLDGFQVLGLIRQCSNVPVIMLTGKGEVAALREALVLGADDYVRKPCGTQELMARIRAKLRRAQPGATIFVQKGYLYDLH